MPHAAYRIGIGAGALALIAALGFTVFAADPPAGAAPEAGSSAPGQTASKPMAKAIVTGDRPAIVTVQKPLGPTRSLGGEAEGMLQITVRPEAVERSEPYLVNVYVLPPEAQPAPGTRGLQPPSGDQPATPGTPTQPPAEGTLIGSFSFFPPPRAGEERTFTLPSPQSPVPAGADVALKVELVPSTPGSPLQKSTLAIVDARIGPP